MPTPSEELAVRIAERLVSEGLLTTEQKDGVLPKLADGSMKPEDWSLAVEMSDVGGKAEDE